jgi:hypothetical protein
MQLLRAGLIWGMILSIESLLFYNPQAEEGRTGTTARLPTQENGRELRSILLPARPWTDLF